MSRFSWYCFTNPSWNAPASRTAAHTARTARCHVFAVAAGSSWSWISVWRSDAYCMNTPTTESATADSSRVPSRWRSGRSTLPTRPSTSCAISAPPLVLHAPQRERRLRQVEQPLQDVADDGRGRGRAVPALLHDAHDHVLRVVRRRHRREPRVGLVGVHLGRAGLAGHGDLREREPPERHG